MRRTARAISLLALFAVTSSVVKAEPPDHQALSCTVSEQGVSGAMRLQVRFENQGSTPVELPPGPQLILYADSSATERLDAAARMERVQRTPILVPSSGKADGLFAVSAANVGALLCGGATPAAAAMYFYRFSQRPQFRCILRGFDLQAVSCPSPAGQPSGKQQ